MHSVDPPLSEAVLLPPSIFGKPVVKKKRHYGVENKLINLAKSLSKKMKTGQGWNSDYKTE
jgi:hypothetical protein